MASGSGYSGGNRAYIPDDVNMSRAKVKRKNNDWSWEDEMLMYEVSKKESFKKQKLQISRRADGATWHYINTTTVTNGIHHIAVTWNAQEVTIFLDGKRKETTSMEKKYFEGTANNGEWFDIGKTGDHSMNGWLYELFLANTVLTEEEIYKLAFQGMFICRVD